MKLMIASDIHGSAYYCNLMLKILEAENPDKLLLLGDLLYHGPRNDLPREYLPKKVIEMLNSISSKILAVRGNCEAEVDQMVLNFPVLADYAMVFANSKTFFATHGHVYNENNLPSIGQGDILLNGHTHIPKFIKHENYTFINPGSVSIPKEDSPHSIVIYENGNFKWIDIEKLSEFIPE
ncbi:MAG: phosphodiesterase [Clostridiales bacterium]|nr:MAG: phosphodiesterase [Clostridiales bacterium]